MDPLVIYKIQSQPVYFTIYMKQEQTFRLIDLYRFGQMTIASEASSEELLVDVTCLGYNKAPLLIALPFNI